MKTNGVSSSRFCASTVPTPRRPPTTFSTGRGPGSSTRGDSASRAPMRTTSRGGGGDRRGGGGAADGSGGNSRSWLACRMSLIARTCSRSSCIARSPDPVAAAQPNIHTRGKSPTARSPMVETLPGCASMREKREGPTRTPLVSRLREHPSRVFLCSEVVLSPPPA